MPRPPNSFKIEAKNIFLSYPECSLSKEEALTLIQKLQFPIPPVYIRVAQEEHQDCNGHLHVFLQFAGKFRTQNCRFFDLPSPNRSAHSHPTVLGTRSSSDAKSYISNYVNFIDHGAFQLDPRSSRGNLSQVLYRDAVTKDNKIDALAVIREKHPRSFVLQFRNINASLDRIFQKPPEPFVSPLDSTSFNNVPEELQKWASDNIKEPNNRPCRPISVVIEGQSRTGKTMWARGLGPHNYLCGDLAVNPEFYSNEAHYNIIDNIDPHSLKHFKEFMGAQRHWQSQSKYCKPMMVKGGIPTIFLCNPGSSSSYLDFLLKKKNAHLYEWAKCKALFVKLSSPLYIINKD